MKANRILCLAFGLVLTGSVGAQLTGDISGTIRNVTGFGSDGLTQRDRVSVRAELRGPTTLWQIAAAYTLSVAGGEVSHLPNIESLALTTSYLGDGAPLSRLDFTLGRQRVRDHTGWVLNQVMDGIALTVAYPAVRVTARVATPFLPNKNATPVVLTRGDSADLANPQVFMGSPRVVGLVEVTIPAVLRQEVTLSLGMQEDLRGLLGAGAFPNRAQVIQEGETVQDLARTGLLDTQYAGLGVRGSIVRGLFYNVFGALGTGRTIAYMTPSGSASGTYAYEPILSGMGGVGLSLYAERVLGTVAGLRFVLSTGDDWSERTGTAAVTTTTQPGLFLPITSNPVSPVLGAGLGNLGFVELSYSLRPFAGAQGTALSRLQIGLTGLMFIRPKAGPITVTVSNPDGNSAYLGSELDLRVTWRPFSDLGAEVLAGAFLPNSGANGAFAGEALRTKVQASVSLSL